MSDTIDASARRATSLGYGIWKLSVAVPQNVPPTVNVYALEVESQLVLVDTGWDEHSLDDLGSGLSEIGATLDSVAGIVLTHGHPDHAGLAGRLQEMTDCWVAAHPEEERWFAGLGAGGAETWLDILGAPQAQRYSYQVGHDSGMRVSIPTLTYLADGDRVPIGRARSLETVWTPGHSPGHLCLLDNTSGTLFSGDHVLPNTHAPLYGGPDVEESQFEIYQTSLVRTKALGAVRLLPGHDAVITDPEARYEEIDRHYYQRFADLRRVLRDLDEIGRSATTWEIAELMPRRWTWHDAGIDRLMLASSTVHTALQHLECLGEVRVSTGAPKRWRVTS